MRIAVVALLVAMPLAAADARGRGPEPIQCPADVATALAAACPCDAARTHVRYVACVARWRNALRRARCLGPGPDVLRCAVRSTCGRAAAVVCCMPAGSRVAHDAGSCVASGGVPGGAGSACGACTPTSTTTSTSTTTTTTTTTSTTTTTLAGGDVFGNVVEFPGASAHAADYLLGDPLVLPRAGMLTHLCVIAKDAGPHVMLALYADAGGEPGALVASTPATPMTAGAMEVPVAPTAVAPGTYWMMGVYDADASIGIDESDPSAPVRYAPELFGSPLPDPFGSALEYNGQRFNYYVRVE
jgi:hypothetical protein